jgi:hypothetical protein
MRMALRVGGRIVPALTRYRVRRSSPYGLSWVELEPVTGEEDRPLEVTLVSSWDSEGHCFDIVSQYGTLRSLLMH